MLIKRVYVVPLITILIISQAFYLSILFQRVEPSINLVGQEIPPFGAKYRFSPKDLVNTTYLEALFDPPKLPPTSLEVAKGRLLSGDVHSLQTETGLVMVESVGGTVEIYIDFYLGGEGKVYWTFTSTISTVASLRYFSAQFGIFLTYGNIPLSGNATLGEEAINYEGGLTLSFKFTSTSGEFNLTIYQARFDPSPIKRDIAFNIIGDGSNLYAHGETDIDIAYTKVIFLDIPRNWEYVNLSTNIEWDFKTMSFMARKPGSYKLIFKVLNYWDYSRVKMVSINLLDSENRSIPLYQVNAYVREVDMQTNVSEWFYRRNITVYNPYPIDLFNATVKITLTKNNFDFFKINGDPREIQFILNGEIIPHRVLSFDGSSLSIEALLPTLSKLSSKNITLAYGGKDGIEFKDSEIGYYGTDYINGQGVDDITVVKGDKSLVFDSSSGNYYLLLNSTNDIGEYWFDNEYPQQIRYLLYINIKSFPLDFSLNFRNESNLSYLYRIYIGKTNADVYTYTVLYRNDSGNLIQLTTPKLTLYPLNKRSFLLELGINQQSTYLKVGGIEMHTYTFQSEYQHNMRLGFIVNNSKLYIDKLIVRNYYDNTLGYVLGGEKISNIIYDYGEEKRLLGPLVGSCIDLVELKVFDDLGNLVYYNLMEPETSINIPTKLTKVQLVNLDDRAVEASISDITRTNVIVETLIPKEKETIYLSEGLDYLVEWSYLDGSGTIMSNFTLTNGIDLALYGDTISDAIGLIREVNVTYLNSLKAYVNSMSDEIIGNITSVNSQLSATNETIITKLELSVETLNDSISIWIYDKLSNTTMTIIETFDQYYYNLTKVVDEIADYILGRLEVRRIKLVNKYDLLEIEDPTFKIILGNYTLTPGSAIIVASKPRLKVIDYWGRELNANISETADINLIVEVAYIYVVNNRLETLTASVRPAEILDKPLQVIVPGLDYVKIIVPLGKYALSIYDTDNHIISEYTVDFKKNLLVPKYEKTIYVKGEKGETISLKFDSLTTLLSFGLVATSIGILVVKRSRSIQRLEIDEDDELEV